MGRIKYIIGVDYGTTFTGKQPTILRDDEFLYRRLQVLAT